MRQSHDQVQMQMDVPALPQIPDIIAQPRPVIAATYGCQRRIAQSLHANFKLEPARLDLRQPLDLFGVQQIRHDFKMKIRRRIRRGQESPNFPVMFRPKSIFSSFFYPP